MRDLTVRRLGAILVPLVLSAVFVGTGLSGAQEAAPKQKQAAPMAQNPALEARVMAIAEELRCLVCQNETIAASHADLAIDLRKQIRVKLTQGQSQQQILDFMVERYGDFVLYRPPLKATTVLLWAGPFALLAVAVIVLMLNIRRRRLAEQPKALSPEEILRAQQLLGGDAFTMNTITTKGNSKP
jgi:cytochrome c-type biogenesis protein CcmH